MSGKSKAKAKSEAQGTSKSKSTDVAPEPQERSTTITSEPASDSEQPPTPEEAPTPEPAQESMPEPEPVSTPTLDQLYQEVLTLKQLALEHSGMIVDLQQALARKRKPVVSNGKVTIKDKQTGTVYPSKNNAYQSLLKADELKSLVDKGLFGDVPEKNTFGWYVLVREWPDRFEEVHEAQNTQ